MTNPDASADSAFMRRALELAELGWGRVAPNPLVGAVVVRDGRIVGEGWHAEYGGAHAEVVALRDAGELARGATVYVTLEPCAHSGKTPPCTGALLDAGVARLVFAVADPNPEARGGAAMLADAGVQVTGGVEEAAACRLNGPFLHAFRRDGASRPWVELKLALTLDARVADHTGASKWITGPEARAEVHRLRAGHDAVAIGSGTALADDPMLTVRDAPAPRRAPVRVVFDRRARLPLDCRLVRSAGDAPVLLLHGPDAEGEHLRRYEAEGVMLRPAGTLREGLRTLRAEGIRSVFCEGGATMAGALLQEGCVDRLTLIYAPLLLGPGGRAPFADMSDPDIGDVERWQVARRLHLGDDTLISLER